MRVYVLVLVAAVVEVGAYTTRSYDLEVPGSRPIRIIEADPVWDRGVVREHRTVHPLETTTTERPDSLRRRDSDYQDNSHKLKDFLENYAEGLKHRRPLRNEDDGEDELYLKDVDLPEDDEDDDEKETKRPEKSKSWNMVHAEKHNNPYDDDKGWVSMEAVPWSMSKISKWQNKPQPDKYSNPYGADRYHDYNKPHHPYQQNFPPKPTYSKPTHRPMKPTPSYYNNEDEDEDEEPDYPHYTNNKKRPQYPRPTATYGQKVHVHTVPPQHKPWDPHPQKHDCKQHHNRPEIITDGLPPDFPDPNFDYANRRRGSSENLPNTHPFKGDVLPPLKDSNVNMTTSHGGLLQVESSFQTVDEAQKAFVKKQKLKTKRKPIKLIRPNPTSATYQQVQNFQNYQLEGNRDSTDTAGVLAAVGAGMIPASMALLVPMAMNGRKRRDLKHPTTSPYVDRVELTLPRSF